MFLDAKKRDKAQNHSNQRANTPSVLMMFKAQYSTVLITAEKL